jgi:hypothetical protein
MFPLFLLLLLSLERSGEDVKTKVARHISFRGPSLVLGYGIGQKGCPQFARRRNCHKAHCQLALSKHK